MPNGDGAAGFPRFPPGTDARPSVPGRLATLRTRGRRKAAHDGRQGGGEKGCGPLPVRPAKDPLARTRRPRTRRPRPGTGCSQRVAPVRRLAGAGVRARPGADAATPGTQAAWTRPNRTKPALFLAPTPPARRYSQFTGTRGPCTACRDGKARVRRAAAQNHDDEATQASRAFSAPSKITSEPFSVFKITAGDRAPWTQPARAASPGAPPPTAPALPRGDAATCRTGVESETLDSLHKNSPKLLGGQVLAHDSDSCGGMNSQKGRAWQRTRLHRPRAPSAAGSTAPVPAARGTDGRWPPARRERSGLSAGCVSSVTSAVVITDFKHFCSFELLIP